MPSLEGCIEKGDLVSTWFAERILNTDKMCDYAKGNCVSLFGGAGAPKK